MSSVRGPALQTRRSDSRRRCGRSRQVDLTPSGSMISMKERTSRPASSSSLMRPFYRRARARVHSAPVDGRLRALDALGLEPLHRLRGVPHDRLGVVVWLEVREYVVGERARVAALGPADADAQAQEVLRLQVRRDRAKAVVAAEAAAE